MNTEYTKPMPRGLGKMERERLSAILCKTKVTISVAEVADILNIPSTKAAKLLAGYAKKGWLTRISPGTYIPIPLESSVVDVALEDPLAIAEKLFAPCYIAGWSAAQYWGMTDQIFRSIVIMTQHQQKDYSPIIKDTEYLLHFSQPALFFGLKIVWRSNIKVYVSGPTRTIVDMMNNMALGGGLRLSVDIMKNYFGSEKKSPDVLIDYMRLLNNGAAYKRLGFLVERYFPDERKLINECRARLTAGNAKLDPTLRCNKLVTKWRLFVPQNWR